jgi:hypothetical protein
METMNDSESPAIDWDAPVGAVDGYDEAADWGEGDVLDNEPLRPTGFAEWFVVSQTAIPALLFFPGSQAFRLPVRVGAYAVPLIGLAIWWVRRTGPAPLRHPAQRWLMLATVCLSVMILHPLTSSPTAGVAQTLLYFSVFSALFWAPSFVDTPRALVRILAILLVCNGVNAMVGVLQVYDPERFMPRELSFVFTGDSNVLAASSYRGPDGRVIIRPPGLFDTPGAVCGPGTIAALLGLVFALERFAWWKRLAALTFAVAGIAAIYLSHVRANLVVVIGMMALYAALLVVQRQRARAMAFVTLCVGLIAVGLVGASMIGGESIVARFSSLLSQDPRSLYYASRGEQLAVGFAELLDDYPWGAGLARWGMMRGYFGDPSNLDSTALWAEVQPNAWMLDGGLFLLGLYGMALVATALFEWRLVAALPDAHDRRWAIVVASVNMGTLALIFSFVPFTTQVGLQFWFLEGALFGAMAYRTYSS